MSVELRSRGHRRRVETRKRIREAAGELFRARGYDATTVAQICHHADVARQTFFNHFETKSDVLQEIDQARIDSLSLALDAAWKRGETMRERLALFFGESVRAALGIDVRESLLSGGPRPGPTTRSDGSASLIPALFLQLVQREVDAGSVTRRHDPELLADLVEGALAAFASRCVTRHRSDTASRIARLAALVADALEPRPDEAGGPQELSGNPRIRPVTGYRVKKTKREQS
jgi:Transcriptional regulator